MKTILAILFLAVTFQLKATVVYLPFYNTGITFTDVTNGLISRYTLAGDVNDHFGNFNGTAVASPTYTTGPLGVASTAIHLNGSSQYVSIPSGVKTVLQGLGAATISFWVNATSSTQPQFTRIVGCYTGNDNDFSLSLNAQAGANQNEFDFNVYNGGSGNQYVFSAVNTMTPTVWQLVTCVFDNTTAKIYVNGSLISTSTGGAAIPSTINAGLTANYAIGGLNSTGGFLFAGDICGVRFYHVALTGSDCSNLYYNGINGGIF